MRSDRELLARLNFGLAACLGAALSWVIFAWLGGAYDHCDYPDECLYSWLPRVFDLVQYLLVGVVLVTAMALALALRGTLPRRAVVLAGLATATMCLTGSAMLIVAGVTPLVDLGQAVRFEVYQPSVYMTTAPAYELISLVTFGMAHILALVALRPGRGVEDYSPG